MTIYDLSGKWNADIGDDHIYEMMLPGTLDENGIGYKDIGANQWHPDAELGNANAEFNANAPIATRFTRKHQFEGEVSLRKRVSFKVQKKKRYFLEAERARCLRLFIDGQEVSHFVEPSISTPHIFEVSDLLLNKQTFFYEDERIEQSTILNEYELTILSDNSYPGLPHDAILASSAATDETQTNWNGLLGYFRIRQEEEVFISSIRVYPYGKKITVHVEISAAKAFKGKMSVTSPALQSKQVMKEIDIQSGMSEIILNNLVLDTNIKQWDIEEGHLYEITVGLENCEEKTVSFGVRDFGDDGRGRLSLNGRTIFLRSEANCGEFPETGYSPMTVEEWTDVLMRYRSYGINCVRFHSHCPPEAAFFAADKIGMLMQPELSHWNPKNAFESEESFAYYKEELEQILYMLANHPSFVMLTFGNELQSSELGRDRMNQLITIAHAIDDTRMIANGSNVHYGARGCDAESDFYTAQSFFDNELRGTFANMKGYINHQYPNAKTNYDGAMTELRREYKKPVFSFEVGQYEILPDFGELEDFQGISDPVNYKLIQKRVEMHGLTDVWKQYVEVTGELACIGYREEIEAAMRTKELSGISLLGLQDFPGQGTALVGMLNSHLKPKPYAFAQPDKFQKFFRDQLPLVLLKKYTYENTEVLEANVQVANFGKQDVCGVLRYELSGEDIVVKGKGESAKGNVKCPVGQVTDVGVIKITLAGIDKPSRLNLRVEIGNVENSYPVWVYPKVMPDCSSKKMFKNTEGKEIEIYEARYLDEYAKKVLECGGIVYLSPDSEKEVLPCSVQAQFTTDFWSVGTFAGQEGAMGQLINRKHPIFKHFPTEIHTNWQWWPMAVQRAIILPQRYEAIITELDSYAFLRPMAQLLECKCMNGRLLLSSLGLQNLQQYPECRALQHGIYCYLKSEEFKPTQSISSEIIEKLVVQKIE